MLSREELKQVFAEKGSVIIDGVLYRSEADLPSEAELSAGDEGREEQAAGEILAEMERLQNELNIINERKSRENAEAANAATQESEAKADESKVPANTAKNTGGRKAASAEAPVEDKK